MAKLTTAGTTVELARVGDSPAYWRAGDLHEIVVTDPDGDKISHTSRLAANTLLWTEGPITYRLESSLGRQEAVDLAEEPATVTG
jgi:hypothetical protein